MKTAEQYVMLFNNKDTRVKIFDSIFLKSRRKAK